MSAPADDLFPAEAGASDPEADLRRIVYRRALSGDDGRRMLIDLLDRYGLPVSMEAADFDPVRAAYFDGQRSLVSELIKLSGLRVRLAAELAPIPLAPDRTTSHGPGDEHAFSDLESGAAEPGSGPGSPEPGSPGSDFPGDDAG